ncbi:MAG: hypothetical protein HON90_07425 [Halobacteriovoraceae bacterium]|jgi:hypothetical protein|nr:hypothetical protein [Halobacteriovoraceae bacterium]
MKKNVNTCFLIIGLLSLMLSCKEPIPVIQACTLVEEPALTEEPTPTLVEKIANNDSEDVAPKPCVIPEAEENAKLEISAVLQDFSIEQEEKMHDALARLKIVINSKEFKQKVLDHQFEGQNSFEDNDGLTNEEIYDLIMLGSEVLQPEDDEQMDLDITLYYASNSTVGYTYPDTVRTWINNKFFKTYTLGKVAGNVAHEWTHKLGFGHDFRNTANRKYSVPYGVGNIVKELVDKM